MKAYKNGYKGEFDGYFKIDSSEIYTFPEEQPLSFGKVALISVGIAIVIWGLFVAFQLAFIVPVDVREEVLSLIV